MSAALEFQNISVAIESGRLLLDDVSLTLEEGTVTAILGRSGSGKTTILRTANRMIDVTRGQIYVAGATIRELSLVQLRRKMGYVIQETGLFPHFSVERNIGILLEAEGQSREQRVARSNELLQLVGLDPTAFSPSLSASALRRTAAACRVGARAGCRTRRSCLWTSPSARSIRSPAPRCRICFASFCSGLKHTVLLVTHDLDEALYLADRIVLLGEGRLIANLAA